MEKLPEVVLCKRLLLVCAVDGIKSLEGRLGPDAEAAEVATWRDLEQVQVVHIDQGNTFKN